MSIAETFGKRITTLRNERKMTRAELSKLISLSENVIIELESGKRNPTIPEVVLLGKFFNVSYDYILGQSENRIAQDFIDKAEGDEALASLLQRFCSLPEEAAEAVLQILLKMDPLAHEQAKMENDKNDLEK